MSSEQRDLGSPGQRLRRVVRALAEPILEAAKAEEGTGAWESGPEAYPERIREALLDAFAPRVPHDEVESEAEAPTVFIDVERYEQFYRQYSPRIYGFLLRMVHDRPTAEDLLQDIFLKVLPKLHLIRDKEKTAAWLHRIAFNQVMEARREASRRREVATDDLALLDSQGKSEEAGLRHDLEKAISSLPEEQRAVLIKHDIEGWNHQEIAEMMGKQPSTVRSELTLARRRVRAMVAGQTSTHAPHNDGPRTTKR
ncbi:MAG TPA: RNA polymerase sigma factor [Terriglobales bacterium]|nr:RNA polymerase sigma factor [Terriglobales bacterium]